MNFPLRTFQSLMEGHHTSSSLGDAAMRVCPQVCLTDVCPKRAPKNFSSRLNPTNDYQNIYVDFTHAKANKRNICCSDFCHEISTKQTTDLYEGPSGSNVNIHTNGEFIRNITHNIARFHFHVSHVQSSTSIPSIDHDKDPYNIDNQQLTTLFTCGLIPPVHYIQFEYIDPISSPGLARSWFPYAPNSFAHCCFYFSICHIQSFGSYQSYFSPSSWGA